MQKFDLVVIGSGPGGQRAAVQAAKLGRTVAIVERASDLGGVCINTGTIPSKTLREAVLDLSGQRQRRLYQFRNRHGFTDASDAAFDRLWSADGLSWADISSISEEALAALPA